MPRPFQIGAWKCQQCGISGRGWDDLEAHQNEHIEIHDMLHAAALPCEGVLPLKIFIEPIREWG